MTTLLLFICALIIGCFIGMGLGVSFVVSREDDPMAVMEELVDILLNNFSQMWKKLPKKKE